MQRDLSDFISLTSGKLLRIPLAVLSASLLARAIGPDGVGKWAMILAVSNLFHSFLFSWTQSYNVRFGREEWILKNKLSDIWATRWPLIVSGICLTTVFLFLQPFSFFDRFFNLSIFWWPYILIFILGQWFFSESQSLFRVTEKIGTFALIPILIELITITYLTILIFQSPNLILHWVVFGMILITTVISGLAWLKELFFSRSFGGKSNWEERKNLIKYSWPLIPGLCFGYLSNWGDHILLQYFKSAKDVGFFSTGYQVMQALAGFSSSVSILYLPKLIDQKLEERGVEQDYLTRVAPTIISLWLIILIPTFVIIPWVFTLVFGSDFLEAIPVVLLLCAAVPGSIFSATHFILYELQGRLGKASLINATTLALNFIVSLALVVRLGSIGVALGTAISFFLTQMLCVLDQHKYLKIPMKRMLVLLIFCTFFGACQCIIGVNYLHRIVTAILSLVCLIALARQFGIIDRIILTRLLSGKLLAFQPLFFWLFIKKKQ